MSPVRRWVGSIVAAIVAGGSFRRDAADGVDDADIEPDRIDDPLAADDDGLDEDPTGH
jgi:hypothetical protein